MNKQILFSLLLITNTLTHGMKRPNIVENNDAVNTAMVLFNDDLIPQITDHLCMSHNYQPCGIRTDIRSLSDTNKFFHDYYAQEKIAQGIIRSCLRYNNSNDKSTARELKCRAIYAKIKHFTDTARFGYKKFSENDLLDPWYLAITTTYGYKFYGRPLNRSLVYIAIDNLNLETAITILNNTEKLSFNYGHGKNPLFKIADHLFWLDLHEKFDEKKCKKLLTIAQGLLKKGILPDGREGKTQYTPLNYSVTCKKFVRLLLEYGANPYLETYSGLRNKMVNAFDIEPEEGWLQEIIDEVAENKKLKINNRNSCIKK